jgi:subtilisin
MTDSVRPPRGHPRGQPTEPAASARPDTTGLPTREPRYLIAAVPRQLVRPSIAPTDDQTLLDDLRADPAIRILRIIEPQQRTGMEAYPLVAVATMPADTAAGLAASPCVHIEVDQPLDRGSPTMLCTNPALGAYRATIEVAFEIVDMQGRSLAEAVVSVVGRQSIVHATTDTKGHATVPIPITDLDQIAGVLVRPASDAWSSWQARPVLSSSEPSRIVCTAIEAGPWDGWPRRALGLDRLAPTYLGHGVKVAIVDSGCAEGSDVAVTDGLDVLTADSKGWREDPVGYGTHTAAILTGIDPDRPGLAPQAEVHVCKVDPGGHYSDLIDALDYCIAHNMDVVELGLGGTRTSWLLGHKLEQARRAGVAVIAAAGDGGTPTFPATADGVLSVGALGLLGTFPPGSHHATLLGGVPGSEGFFVPWFSSHSMGVDLWAPGVAVVSAAAAGGVVALDSTSVAAAYVTALAALMLAHHPDLHGGRHLRGSARVDRLHHLLRASARPVLAGQPYALPLAQAPTVGLQTVTSTSHREHPAGDLDPNAAMAQLQTAMHAAGLLHDTPEPSQ